MYVSPSQQLVHIIRIGLAATENNTFFVKPLENVTKGALNRGTAGHQLEETHSTQKLMGKMCSLAGIEGRVTHHSMCATSVTQMYAKGVLEKVIQGRTGNRSLHV